MLLFNNRLNTTKKAQHIRNSVADLFCFPFSQIRQENLAELEKKYKKVTPDDAEPHWNEQYKTSENTCSHAYW